jgi:hypothetical protein
MAKREEDLAKEGLKDLLADIINESMGIKATELAAHERLTPKLKEIKEAGICLVDLLSELRDEGRIVEVEYILPDYSYRLKSFYLPSGTKINMGFLDIHQMEDVNNCSGDMGHLPSCGGNC